MQAFSIFPQHNRNDLKSGLRFKQKLSEFAVALNYQTFDRPRKLNLGKFLQNGNCGYVLKPQFLREAPNSTTTGLDHGNQYVPICHDSLHSTIFLGDIILDVLFSSFINPLDPTYYTWLKGNFLGYWPKSHHRHWLTWANFIFSCISFGIPSHFSMFSKLTVFYEWIWT